VATIQGQYQSRAQMADKYVAAYRQYCWPVESIDDLKLAPFHIMATEGGLHTNQSHQWHMENIADLCGANPQLLLATQYRWVDLADESSVAAATSWWETMTTAGGEGIVVKPSEFTPIGANGLLQPAVKCRGPEYLRIIYGPEYDRPEYLTRLRQRSLNGKRALALREFALGVEALERFVARAPLRQVHECVFGVLALESEPIDPRL
jgi:protein phosphatase